MDIQTASTAELLAFYNEKTGKDVKKFSDLATARRRCAALLAEETAPPQQPKPHAAVPSEPDPGEAAPAEKPKKKAKGDAAAETKGAAGWPFGEKGKKRGNGAAKQGADTTPAPSPEAAPSAPDNKPPRSSRSEAIARTWQDPAVRAARSSRTSITVDGTAYKSVSDAFRQLHLPMSTCIRFRGQLKAEGRKTFEHGGKKYAFAVTETK